MGIKREVFVRNARFPLVLFEGFLGGFGVFVLLRGFLVQLLKVFNVLSEDFPSL